IMRQPSSSVLPETGSARDDPRRAPRPRAPIVERIAGWSARHRKTAVLGWFVLVVAVFVGTHMIQATNVQSYDAGQSGRAEQTLNRLNVTFPPAESVLVQARGRGATFATDAQLRQATRQVVS